MNQIIVNLADDDKLLDTTFLRCPHCKEEYETRASNVFLKHPLLKESAIKEARQALSEIRKHIKTEHQDIKSQPLLLRVSYYQLPRGVTANALV